MARGGEMVGTSVPTQDKIGKKKEKLSPDRPTPENHVKAQPTISARLVTPPPPPSHIQQLIPPNSTLRHARPSDLVQGGGGPRSRIP
jgi:hypothetical protein